MKHFTDNQLVEKYNETRVSPSTLKEIEGEVFRRHFGLVVTIAGEYPIDGMDRDDRAAECIPAMLKAFREFDATQKKMSVKGFIKFAVRRRLVDLYRSRNQVSEVPAHLMAGIDDPTGLEDGGTVGDMIADPSSVAAEVELRDEARDAVERLAVVSEHALTDIMAKAAATGMQRLAASFLMYAEHRFATNQLSPENFADIKELFADTENASRLFSLAPEPESDEAKNLLRGIFQSYAGLQYAVLQGVAVGELIPEIAASLGVPDSLVSEILAAVREVRSTVFGGDDSIDAEFSDGEELDAAA